MVAHETREGQVFQRLFEKIEEQVYDVLGDSHINTSLRELLIRAIRDDNDPARLRYMEEVIESDIGRQLEEVLVERALVSGLGEGTSNDEIRALMEQAKSRKLQPWFVEAFFTAALQLYNGRITRREAQRFEITRVPAAMRSHADASRGPVHDRYHRVTFDKRHVLIDGGDRAELISPGTALLGAVIDKVLADFSGTLQSGATRISTSYVERQNLTMRMGMRRFTRLTNGFSKKIENLTYAVSMHYMHYNFCRPHATLIKRFGTPTTPAMAAGVATYPWSVHQLVGLLD
jgi:hypothetical protein